MDTKLAYCTVDDDHPRKVIHVVHVVEVKLDSGELGALAERMRERALAKLGDQDPAVVVVQHGTEQDPVLLGEPYAVQRVRAAMSGGDLSWRDVELD